MAQYHHLLPFLALIVLLILPSSSHAILTDALFSETNDFIFGGQNLTNGNGTLSLLNNCGLSYYIKGQKVVDFNTTINGTKGCTLSVTRRGLLSLDDGSGNAPRTLGTAGELGEYVLLASNERFGVYGPRIWDNGVSRPPSTTLENKKLLRATSNNFIYSDNSIDGIANGNATIATNDDVKAYITQKCTLSVKNSTGTIWESTPSSNESNVCSLWLTNRGPLLLQYEDSKGLQTQWTGGAFEKVNLYVALLRSFGKIGIYGLKDDIRDISPYPGSAAENIKMVTA
ncbi:uncharacterized protein LOC120270744 [Dioscorea cayenensis subsp. rotundata]|uniref:Uncharacterized protein LOC120270744 n=1 Tax=Dioscorea cayennensis subsp. rotundata TaxID=55577 RepID=A0AB40C317_DIOCR|nr:uncharacterized protein LOC120270744 [Dioscorea cayenensis subsp. rotundata]